ncbi:MAG: PD40 domain-containing protein [Chloroflexi bacterium]|nr:PD40 domain-containing protein [Chloroflexota bacterium]
MYVTPRVFISYARADGDTFAADLRTRLAAELGAEALWRDRDRMEGGVSWWNQITEALDAVSFMVLVATPAAMVSPIVRKEWRYARQQGVCVYPVQVPDLPIDFATLPSWMRNSHFYNLDKEWETFVNYLKNPCHLEKVPFMVPDLPAHFVERPREFGELINRLLDADRQNPLAITTVLKGAGGFGKTTLALALCHDEDVQTAFDDGILWVTLGEQPDVLGGLIKLYSALTDDRPAFVDAEDAAAKLAARLNDKKCLIVVDDVWRGADLRPFLRGAPNCAYLITTRNVDVAVSVQATTTDVDRMKPAESAALLSQRIDGLDANALRRMAHRLGEWALLLELANAMLRERIAAANDTPTRAFAWLEKVLDRRGVNGIKSSTKEDRQKDAAHVLASSLELLTAAQRDQLCALAVFKDVDVPLAAVSDLWGLDEFEAEDTCLLLARLSLIKFDAPRNIIRMHNVVREYLGTCVTDMPALHRILIDVWGDAYTLPYSFAWMHYAYHLISGGRANLLRDLLLDYRWLRAKLAVDPNSLIVDCEMYLHPAPNLTSQSSSYWERGQEVEVEIPLVQSAISNAAHILIDYPRQFAGQLIGRLLVHNNQHPRISALLADAAVHTDLPALLPTLPTLTPAGGALLRTLTGHAEGVNHATWSPDGSRILSASYDGALKLWDAASGQELLTFIGHTSIVIAAMWSPDGSRILSVGASPFDKIQVNTLKVWDDASGQELLTLTGHTSGVNAAAWSPDGSCILSASYDGSLKVWDTTSGQELLTLIGHTWSVNAVAWSPDGQRIVSAAGSIFGNQDYTLKVWDISSGKCILTLTGTTGNVNSVAWSPDGQRIVSASFDGALKLWDAASGQELLTLQGHGDDVNAVAWSPDGSRILSASSDNTLKLWDAASGQCLLTLQGHTRSVNAAAWSPDGSRILSASSDNTLKLWMYSGAAGNEAVQKIAAHADGVSAAAWSPDGRHIISASYDGTLKLWNSASGKDLFTLRGHTSGVNAAAWSPDGRRIISASYDGTLKLWNSASGYHILTLIGHSFWVNAVAWSPDGRRIISASSDRTLKMWNVGSELGNFTLTGQDDVTATAWSPDGRGIVLTSQDNTFKAWDVGSELEILTLTGHRDDVKATAWSPDGRRIISASQDDTLKVWDTNVGRCLRTLTEHTSGINALAWSSDGSRFLSASWDCTIRLWDAASGGELFTLAGHMLEVRAAAWSPDGRRVISASWDRTIRLWDADTGVPLARFDVDAPVMCIAWSPDGQFVAAGDAAGNLHIFRVVGLT